MKIWQGIVVYLGCILFCVAVYTGMVWLYLAHPVGFYLACALLVGLIVAVCWDDLFPAADPEPPILWRVK